LLSLIHGYGELLRDEFDDDEPGAELVDEVMHATRRASTLTRQLLTLVGVNRIHESGEDHPSLSEN